jgi:toxin-antitoxin system PIN domain toxin
VIHLLDVNLLVSLAWPNHVHHRPALRWFSQRDPRRWATTPVTECGFVRVSSNRSAIPTAVSPNDALSLLERMRAVGGHTFLPDDIELVRGDPGFVDAGRIVSHGLVTDVHLLALARRYEAQLATLDRGIKALAGAHADSVVLVPLA